MSSATPAAAIEARLRAAWTATPIQTDNVLEDLPEPPMAFVALEFPGGAAEQITIGAPGANLFREDGAFMVHVFVPVGTGAAAARSQADQIAAIFRAQSFDGVRCWAPFPPHESPRSDGNYWGVSFGVPYQWDRFA